MSTIPRREFLGKAAGAMGAVFAPAAFGEQTTVAPASRPTTAPSKLKAGDVIAVGRTGIKASPLAFGTGTESGAEQRRLGIEGLGKLLRHGFDQGVRWWDVADSHKTHPHVKAALKEMRRDQVTITSQTAAKDGRGIKADIERFGRRWAPMTSTWSGALNGSSNEWGLAAAQASASSSSPSSVPESSSH